ncbi:MAG: F0F1 ATP synthase subunit delta [Nocardioides sp.]|nr:F0F1 ATP synthase subunit delta [Nocardioides sp.]
MSDFRGASADAFAAVTTELDTAVGGSVEQASKVGGELFSVAAVFRSEPSLRRVVTDVSVPGEAKSGLVRDVFDTKLDESSLTVVTTAVTRRWTRGRDLADALERAGVIALVKSAESDSGRLSDELFEVGQLVKDNPALRDALSDPARSAEDKRHLVHGLLDGKALPATVALVDQSLAGTYRTVGVALHEYQQVAAQVHDQSVAEVRVAHPLPEAEVRRLSTALSRQYGREVHLNVVVDPDVIGGLRVEIGDDGIDGTVASRLSEAGRKLAG